MPMSNYFGFLKTTPGKNTFLYLEQISSTFSLLYISNKKDAKMASAHTLQCLKIGILLLAKIVNGVFLYRRRQINIKKGDAVYIRLNNTPLFLSKKFKKNKKALQQNTEGLNLWHYYNFLLYNWMRDMISPAETTWHCNLYFTLSM